MRRIFGFIRRYTVVAITIVVGVVGLVLFFSGLPVVAQWLTTAYAIVIAAMQAWDMLRGLFKGRVGIDILAIIAIAATLAVGEYWASLVIVLMLSGGEALEDFASQRARREVSALLERTPVQAHRVATDESIVDVPIDEVAIGDVLLVRPAEVVPVDGLLMTEAASVDESSLTGESLPVELMRGASVMSGSVNGPSVFTMRASAVAADSQYQRVVALVGAAAESRAPIVRLADRFAVPFTLVALAIAGLAWWLSGDPVRFAEVMVVATPCPLLIAAPVAFIAGMSRSAKAGVIVKGGGTLEQLSRVRTVGFDKTGTLTHGTPDVVDVRPSGGLDAGTGGVAAGLRADELLSLVASVEQYSSHVLAASILATATRRGLTIHPGTDAAESATNGVEATVEGRRVAVGKRAFIAGLGAVIDSPLPVGGQLAVYVAVDGQYAGEVILADRVRENAAATVQRLRELGVRDILMLTGDLRPTAEHVAQQVGIEHVEAECLPEDKVRIVSGATERPVMMVGDGVNDAPVLASADIGVAMGARGSTAASESADVVIMLDDIGKTVRAVEIGRATTRVALESIWIGIGLSIGLMIVATFGLLPAIVGAVLQEVVDLATILWALRALGGPAERALVGARAVSAGAASGEAGASGVASGAAGSGAAGSSGVGSGGPAVGSTNVSSAKRR
ncbi:heavy metal translocating P-type ATPase [Rathayibacter soli]|uniref:heavy metal translocating P-type ATPase n=1 Tax=Rathayibacter soli TaxID=3144168 RepID=UPI0027E47860|nr:heavy metal translocating P-type ATPase [Glaciibacter superstes]